MKVQRKDIYIDRVKRRTEKRSQRKTEKDSPAEILKFIYSFNNCLLRAYCVSDTMIWKVKNE